MGNMDAFFVENYRYWELFQTQGKIHPNVRPAIARSWERCRAWGVNQEYSVKSVTNQELDALLEKNRTLLDIAHPILENLIQLVKGSQNVITLHDRDCYLIDYVSDHLYNPAPSFGVGAHWTEKNVGTNGLHLAMIEDQPFQVIGPEHYLARTHSITCSAAPIHDEHGNVIGSLNMTGPRENSNSHTLGMVALGAIAIERELALIRSHQLLENTFQSISEGLVVLDNHFRIQQFSRSAARILQLDGPALQGVDFRQFFQGDDFEQQVRRTLRHFNYSECDLHIGGRVVTCHLSVTPTLIRRELSGVVLVIREIKNITKLVNQFAGNHSRYTFEDIITGDSGMHAIINSMKNISSTECCILLEGESGTGKELFAHAIHSFSNRRQGPFVAVNCASLPHNLVESELFGYEKGAFTGARQDGNPGKFELANGGTIFLDEIGELPLEIQASLLRVLDNHRVMRIGGKTEKMLDVRIIAATNRDLYQEVQRHTFRSDLYFRINVISFNIPPLRERVGDIRILARHFFKHLQEKNVAPDREIDPQVFEYLEAYNWPGNVRELQNVVTRTYYSGSGSTVTADALPQEILTCGLRMGQEERAAPSSGYPAASLWASAARDLQERQAIQDALIQCCGDVEQAAAILRLSRATLYRRLKKYEIDLMSLRKFYT